MCSDLLSQRDWPEHFKSDITSFSEKLAVVLTVVLRKHCQIEEISNEAVDLR